jgi:HTH-type transcriptional regulator/antitoxin HigA
MITNETQYRSTLGHLRQFETALANLEARHPTGQRTKLEQLEIGAVASQAEDLRTEIAEYEHLRSGDVSTLEVSGLDQLASLLVQARIARGWTQHQLAETLGVAEQQVQRYEATAYRSASLARLNDVATALGLDTHLVGRLREASAA